MIRPEDMKAVNKPQAKKVMANRAQQIKDAARVNRMEKRLRAYAECMGFVKTELVKEGK